MGSFSDINVDPDELEELASGPVARLADTYDDLVTDIARISSWRDTAFGEPRADAGPELKTTWDEKYQVYYEIIYQTSVNIRSFGLYLQSAAENYRDLDDSLADGFSEHQDLIESGDAHKNDSVDNPGDYQTSAPSPEEKDRYGEALDPDGSGPV